MSKLYQEELAKIMQQNNNNNSNGGANNRPGSPKMPQPPPGLAGLPGLGGEGGGLPPPGLPPAGLFPGLLQGRSPVEIQRAMDIYQQEFSRLQQNALAAALKAQNGKEEGREDEREKSPKIKNGEEAKSPASSPSAFGKKKKPL